MNGFFWLLLSHVVGDMILNNPGLAVAKRSEDARGRYLAIARHAAVHGGFAALFGLFAGYVFWLAGLLVFAQHFAVDSVRCRVERRLFGAGTIFMTPSRFLSVMRTPRRNRTTEDVHDLNLFFSLQFADQGSHILALLGISFLV
ncbi:MAG: DUF3307 domain-containing protein [Desulfatibacillaceae bacterium]